MAKMVICKIAGMHSIWISVEEDEDEYVGGCQI